MSVHESRVTGSTGAGDTLDTSSSLYGIDVPLVQVCRIHRNPSAWKENQTSRSLQQGPPKSAVEGGAYSARGLGAANEE
ncbi:hypothetical protein J6590_017269 [Homalodisca vitripennis]|nr:hypothetical protein J6590_017269 [Homalodisca vitripennis]